MKTRAVSFTPKLHLRISESSLRGQYLQSLLQTLLISVLNRGLVPPLGKVTGYIPLPSVPRVLCSSLLELHAHARSYCPSRLSISSFCSVSGMEITAVIVLPCTQTPSLKVYQPCYQGVSSIRPDTFKDFCRRTGHINAIIFLAPGYLQVSSGQVCEYIAATSA